MFSSVCVFERVSCLLMVEEWMLSYTYRSPPPPLTLLHHVAEECTAVASGQQEILTFLEGAGIAWPSSFKTSSIHLCCTLYTFYLKNIFILDVLWSLEIFLRHDLMVIIHHNQQSIKTFSVMIPGLPGSQTSSTLPGTVVGPSSEITVVQPSIANIRKTLHQSLFLDPKGSKVNVKYVKVNYMEIYSHAHGVPVEICRQSAVEETTNNGRQPPLQYSQSVWELNSEVGGCR